MNIQKHIQDRITLLQEELRRRQEVAQSIPAYLGAIGELQALLEQLQEAEKKVEAHAD